MTADDEKLEPKKPIGVEPLPGEPRRAAVPALRGFDYQVWWSIDAWCRLEVNEVIYLEGAEDFDQLSGDQAIATQIKNRESKISLGTSEALQAIQDYWNLQEREALGRTIKYHFLTRSTVAIEADGAFGGVTGIDAWRSAARDPAAAEIVRGYLLSKLSIANSLRSFVENATFEELQERLFSKFIWLTDQPSVEVVQQSVLDRLTTHSLLIGIPQTEMRKVRSNLFAYSWEQLRKKSKDERVLTPAEFIRQIQAATTVSVSVPVTQLRHLDVVPLQEAQLVAQARAHLSLVVNEIPVALNPLLERTQLVDSVVSLLKKGRSVLLIGSVHKGKTTIGQIAIQQCCPGAWWISLTGRDALATELVMKALYHLVEGAGCPVVIVLDDLDIAASAVQVYEQTLRLLSHRAHSVRKALLSTAQGSPVSACAVAKSLNSFSVVEVPELSNAEIETQCVRFGCTDGELAKAWATIIHAQTIGHPKLVQVRLQELAEQCWPKLSVQDIVTSSPAVATVKQLARELFSSRVSSAEAEFIYTASDATVPLTREMMLNLGQTIAGVANPGDVVDRMTGRWIESAAGNRYRVTPVLTTTTSEIWSAARRLEAHGQISDAIALCGSVTPADAAARVFHAFLADDAQRLGVAIALLQTHDDRAAVRLVYGHLHWLTYVSPRGGVRVFPRHPGVSLILRHLQFSVAREEASSKLGEIIEGWRREIDSLDDQTLKDENLTFFDLSIAIAHDLPIRLSLVLDAVNRLNAATGRLAESARAAFRQLQANSPELSDIPAEWPPAQVLLALRVSSVKTLEDFRELIGWLESQASDQIRKGFDESINWSPVRACGAFVHAAWAREDSDGTGRWNEWLTAIDSAYRFAKEHAALNFGREIAKAKSIILSEYLERTDAALEVLASAERDFGTSAVLREQRANIFFRAQDDESVLALWSEMSASQSTIDVVDDPFAYRRVAISAARLNKWNEAADYFLKGADCMNAAFIGQARAGLLADAAFALWKAGAERDASRILGKAVLELPTAAASDGDGRWEAIQRVMSEIATTLSGNRPTTAGDVSERVTPGLASSPSLNIEQPIPGQKLRSELLVTVTAQAEVQYADASMELIERAIRLESSSYPFVRFKATELIVLRELTHGLSADFIKAARHFHSELAYRTVNHDALTSDSGPLPIPSSFDMEPVIGLLVVGLICSRMPLREAVADWIATSRESCDSYAVRELEQIQTGLSLDSAQAREVLMSSDVPALQRCAAAFVFLQGDQRSARETGGAQALIGSAIVTAILFLRHRAVSGKVIRWLASHWPLLLKERFQFNQPVVNVPRLEIAVSEGAKGRGSLSSFMAVVSTATGVRLGEWLKYLG